MSQKMYLGILRMGIYFAFISFFLVFKNFLFPFITSKQLYFNILIEILAIFWLAFIIKYPAWRPKSSMISTGLVAYFAIVLLSCFTGVDFNLSFWGDIERMLGWFHIFHFLIYYFIVITVIRTWRDWNIFLIISIVASSILSVLVVNDSFHYGTIGNTAYVSGYLIFNLYFCVLLFFKERNWGLKWLYLLPVPLLLYAFDGANTTGAIVGLGFSVMVVLFLYAVLNKNKKIRYTTLILFLVIVSVVSIAYLNKDKDFVHNNGLLKIVADVDFQKNTFKTRLISWKAAWLDFKEHPVLGVGHGNYAVVFDKHFDPVFYNHTRTETYFDRAHNNVIDIASTTGVLGLLAYLSIFIAVAYYLIKTYIKNNIDIHEFVLLTCLIIAYFVQNLAVFDSLVTYVSLMMTLALVYWMSNKDEEFVPDDDQNFTNKEIFSLIGIGLVLVVIVYQYNYKPILMLDGTISGQRAFSSGDVNRAVNHYKRALSYNTGLDRDSRTSLIRSFISNPSLLTKIDKDDARGVVDYIIELAEKNVSYNEGDSMNQMVLSQVYGVAANFYSDNSEMFAYYLGKSLETIDRSIMASPRRTPIYFNKAQIYINMGDQESAINTLKYAISLNEDYPDSYCQLSRVYLFYKMEKEAYEQMNNCIDKDGAKTLTPAGYVKMLLDKYIEEEDWPRSISLLMRMMQLGAKNDPQYWVNLAKLYAQNGQLEKSKESALKSIELNPELKEGAEEFIRSIGLEVEETNLEQ